MSQEQIPKPLPTLRVELPPVPQAPERWHLRVVSEEDPGVNRLATAEDATMFLELAGYRVIDQSTVDQLRTLVELTREPKPSGHGQLDCDLFAAHLSRVSKAGQYIANYLDVVLGKP